ncbi:hypothetical protein L208DRAFT_1388235 [Tricholoma matsutake]|nr:hypothetical protein L208DRAFT_1388235 [Tricholoma matsutake 945]
MHLSVAKTTVFAFLCNVALTTAIPTPYFEYEGSLEGRNSADSHNVLQRRQQWTGHTQCEGVCSISGIQRNNPAWGECIHTCLATYYPTPPPSPQGNKPAPKKKQKA